MVGKRTHQAWAPTHPSPLANVQHTRPISQDPTMGLVRDPMFWKRFSRAVHLTEERERDIELGSEGDVQSQRSRNGSVDTKKEEDDWLGKQRKKKRKCRCICIAVTILVLLFIGGVVFLGVFLSAYGKAREHQN